MVMQQPLLIILGLGMALYSWLTTPRQFLLYRDSMVVVYGMPRSRVISFAEISHVELLALPLGERLRIRMVKGSRLMLMMRDPGTFRGHLEDALAHYHGEQTGAAYVDGAILERGSGPEFDYDAEMTESPEAATEFGMSSESGASATSTDEYSEVRSGSYSEGSYSESEGGYSEDSEGTYSDPDEPLEVPSETYSGMERIEDASGSAGSYSESPEPDFSGEGIPAYGADVEIETSPREEDSPERPRSPY